MTKTFTTETPPGYLDDVKKRVLDVIKQQPGVPFSVYLLSELLGILPQYIEAAFVDFEAPERMQLKTGAYLHCSSISKQVIYIP